MATPHTRRLSPPRIDIPVLREPAAAYAAGLL